jgi:hypothetical protein
MAGINRETLIEGTLGRIEIARFQMRIGKKRKGVNLTGCQFARTLEIRNRAIGLTAAKCGIAAPPQGFSFGWLQLDGEAENAVGIAQKPACKIGLPGLNKKLGAL